MTKRCAASPPSAAEAPVVNPAIRSLLLTHGGPTRRVYVFVHGITNSPRQFEELGRLLHARGHTVYVPLMPRHGRRSMRLAELRGLRAEELRDYADAAVDLAAGLGEEIVAVGISGGAAVVGWMGRTGPRYTRRYCWPLLGVWRVSPVVGTAMMNVYAACLAST
jgi:carboxylesterase